jgi:uncharacterized membrane protein
MYFKRLLLLALILAVLAVAVQLGLISLAFEKLGLSEQSALLLLLTTLAGSAINVPLFDMQSTWTPTELPPRIGRIFRFDQPSLAGRTVVAINVGGGVTPLAFSAYLLAHTPVPASDVVLAVGLVAAAAWAFSRPIAGVGIAMPFLVAPLTAALAAMALGTEHRAVLAYVAGTLGVLLGADLARLRDIRRLGVPAVSIGGAGTFDGIFVAGIIAVLLT